MSIIRSWHQIVFNQSICIPRHITSSHVTNTPFLTSPHHPSRPQPLHKRPRFLPLPPHNLHRIVRIVQIIPPGTLMRRISGPNLSELVDMLRLRTINSAVSPRRGAEVGAIGEEGGEGEVDDVGEVGVFVRCAFGFRGQWVSGLVLVVGARREERGRGHDSPALER